jgi:hypothetical protein
MDEFVLTDDEIRAGFGFVGQAVGEGEAWRYEIWAFNTRVDTHKYLFSGPGELFWKNPYTGGLEPLDCSKTYESWGHRLSNTIAYLPPAPDDGAPTGARATFACEVLSPVSGMWIRSQDWVLPAGGEGESMNFRSTSHEPEGADD